MKDVIRTFSKEEYPVFTINDVRMLLKGRGISDGYLHLLLHNLLKNGKITRISKGIYTFHDDAAVVGFGFEPFYYGLEDALRIRHLSGQGTNPTVLTTRTVRQGVRQFKGRNYVVKRIKAEHFFGYDLVKSSGFWLPVSDVEKTVIDTVYFKSQISVELWSNLSKKIDTKKLRGYLDRYNDPEFKKEVMERVGNMRSLDYREMIERLGIKEEYVSYEDVMRLRKKGTDAGKIVRAMRDDRAKRCLVSNVGTRCSSAIPLF
ncbi:MAG: type IV toxin-antitoxin system AbiEi family antitoxin domain-containing protein [Rhabdochlamydiaceae bacterium]